MANPHTGQEEKSKPATDAYRDGWDRIFGGSKFEQSEKANNTAKKNELVLPGTEAVLQLPHKEGSGKW